MTTFQYNNQAFVEPIFYVIFYLIIDFFPEQQYPST